VGEQEHAGAVDRGLLGGEVGQGVAVNQVGVAGSAVGDGRRTDEHVGDELAEPESEPSTSPGPATDQPAWSPALAPTKTTPELAEVTVPWPIVDRSMVFDARGERGTVDHEHGTRLAAVDRGIRRTDGEAVEVVREERAGAGKRLPEEGDRLADACTRGVRRRVDETS